MQYLNQEITAFTASNITETTAVWTSTTAYLANDYVLQGTYIYKCVASNTGNDPELTNGVYWIKWSVSNKWAMLDLASQSKSSVNGGNLIVEFLQNRMTTLTIGNYEAEYVKVELLDTDSTTVLWTYNSVSSINVNVVDYFSYIYSTYGYELDRGIKVDLPLWAYKVRVTFIKSANSTRTACGYLVGGTPVNMGITLYGVKFGFHSFALKDTDTFGTLTIVKRAVQDLVDFETIIDTVELPSMRRQIKSVYNTIVVFILNEASSDYENLLTLGTVESANVVLSNPSKTTMTFSIIEAI